MCWHTDKYRGDLTASLLWGQPVQQICYPLYPFWQHLLLPTLFTEYEGKEMRFQLPADTGVL